MILCMITAIVIWTVIRVVTPMEAYLDYRNLEKPSPVQRQQFGGQADWPANERAVARTLLADILRNKHGGISAGRPDAPAASRNFTPGHELDDWLEAERTVHAKLYG